ncbi:gamma-glutamyl-gamma-aminobutyrate hydrolase family protein [Enterococcus hirae]|nr:gamma-glutamyl-gamma-aminobutyrate hydrolase family protein [Enterococcus hirae]
MEHLPIVGISGNTLEDSQENVMRCPRAYANEQYITAVAENGGVPFVLPMLAQPHLIEAQVRALDALVLTGGQDIDPSLYDEEPHALLGKLCPLRDHFETMLLHYALKYHVPVLGICRGAQLINVTLGGTLYQDLSERNIAILPHFQEDEPQHSTQTVRLRPASFLSRTLGTTETQVNSFHHQSIKRLAKGLRVTAVADDYGIEAIESREIDTFLLGVQWHPEMLQEKKATKKLFRGFLEHAGSLNAKPKFNLV